MSHLSRNSSMLSSSSTRLGVDRVCSYAAKAAKFGGAPAAAGTKQVPPAADPNCLAGLSVVFTGELSAFSRDEIIDIAKRFGA